jgi:hypothetical protein
MELLLKGAVAMLFTALLLAWVDRRLASDPL